MSIPDFAGLPQSLDKRMTEGASMANAVDADSSSTYKGTGKVSRRDKLTLRVAATVIDRLPNGTVRR